MFFVGIFVGIVLCVGAVCLYIVLDDDALPHTDLSPGNPLYRERLKELRDENEKMRLAIISAGALRFGTSPEVISKYAKAVDDANAKQIEGE